MIDSHCHLCSDRFDDDRDAVIERAAKAGLIAVIAIGTDISSSRRARQLAHRVSALEVFATCGVHPHQASAFDDAEWPELLALWADQRVVGVGETGLDYYYDFSERARQRSVMRRHLEASATSGKPAVIHVRDAYDDAFEIIADVGLAAGAVLHCFTGGPTECERALGLGLYVSLSGIVTFRGATALGAAVPLIPDDRLLVETDAPFLAPVPHRGKRNEPAFVVETVRRVAELRGTNEDAIWALTTANTRPLFSMDPVAGRVAEAP